MNFLYTKQAILLLILFLAIGCTRNKLKKQVVETEYSTEIYFIDRDSSKQGIFIELSESKDTNSIAHYKDNKLDGKRTLFYNEGKISSIEHYKNDLFHGEVITYHPNGNIFTKGNYTNNTLDSLFYVYYDSGELKEKVSIADNVENGPFEEYYKSGKLHWKGNFIDGDNEIGPLFEYKEDGTLIKEMSCGKYQDVYICQTVWDDIDGKRPLKLEYEE